MRVHQLLKACAVALPLTGLFIPGAMATDGVSRPATAVRETSPVTDVALGEGGLLTGQVVNLAGAPASDVSVVVMQNGATIATTATDDAGQFAVPGLRGGVYQIETPVASGVVRAWTVAAAPPSATTGVLLTNGGTAYRGQIGSGQYGPAIRGGIAGALLGAGLYWALDHNPAGS